MWQLQEGLPENYIFKERRNEGHQYDFLNVGSMGHASSIALGIALENKDRMVVCLMEILPH